MNINNVGQVLTNLLEAQIHGYLDVALILIYSIHFRMISAVLNFDTTFMINKLIIKNKICHGPKGY